MSTCEFDCDLRCIHCGYVARKPNTRRNCSVDHPPSLTHQLRGYAASLSRWIAAGRPVRPDGDVADLLTICQANQCGQYRDGQCLACGCRVNSSGWAIVNKLRMATENCPKGLWGVPEISFGNVPKTARLRVGFLSQNLIVGGIESWMLSLIGEWARTGAVEVSGVAHVGPAGSSVPIITDRLTSLCPVVASYEIPGGHLVRSPLEAAATVAGASDVLLTWYSSADTLARIKRPDLTLVGVSHGCPDWWQPATKALIDRWAAVSDVAATPIREYSPAVIPLGVDIDRCQSTLTKLEAREALGLWPYGKLCGYVGRLSPEKRIKEIAAAARWLHDDWSFVFVGDGREAPHAIGSNVWRIQSLDNIGDVWRACDVAVVASEAEGYCLAAVEALAAGVPLASTPVGIVPSIPGVELIDQPAEPGEIARAIVAAERRGVSSECREWVTREASAATMAGRWAGWVAGLRETSGCRSL